jgi:hypothetical protein
MKSSVKIWNLTAVTHETWWHGAKAERYFSLYKYKYDLELLYIITI